MGGNECGKDQNDRSLCLNDVDADIFTTTYTSGDIIYFQYYIETGETPAGTKYILMKLGDVGANLVGIDKIIKVFEGTNAKEAVSLDARLADIDTPEFYLNRIVRGTIKKVFNRTELPHTPISIKEFSDINSSVKNIISNINHDWIDTLKDKLKNINVVIPYDIEDTDDNDIKGIITTLQTADKYASPFIKYQNIVTELFTPQVLTVEGQTVEGQTDQYKFPIKQVEKLSQLYTNFNATDVIECIKNINIDGVQLVKPPNTKGTPQALEYLTNLAKACEIYGVPIGGTAISTFYNNRKLTPFAGDGPFITVGLLDVTKKSFKGFGVTSAQSYRIVALLPSGKFTDFKDNRNIIPKEIKTIGGDNGKKFIIFETSLFTSNKYADTRMSKNVTAKLKRGLGNFASSASSGIKSVMSRPTSSVAKNSGGRKRFTKKNRKSKK